MNEISGRAYPAVESYEKRDEWAKLRRQVFRGALALTAGLTASVVIGGSTHDWYLPGIMLVVILPFALWAIFVGSYTANAALDEWLNGATTPEEVQRRHEVYAAQKAVAAAALMAAEILAHEERRRHDQDLLVREMRDYLKSH